MLQHLLVTYTDGATTLLTYTRDAERYARRFMYCRRVKRVEILEARSTLYNPAQYVKKG
jgi:hypothetical protein